MRARPKVVVDMGGYGIEPITYVFGANAVEVAQDLVTLARELTKVRPQG
jgi:predicted fused transcriptional regulator/phosphomethylpyrimidine kinase